jgi:hypothetical protein
MSSLGAMDGLLFGRMLFVVVQFKLRTMLCACMHRPLALCVVGAHSVYCIEAAV